MQRLMMMILAAFAVLLPASASAQEWVCDYEHSRGELDVCTAHHVTAIDSTGSSEWCWDEADVLPTFDWCATSRGMKAANSNGRCRRGTPVWCSMGTTYTLRGVLYLDECYATLVTTDQSFVCEEPQVPAWDPDDIDCWTADGKPGHWIWDGDIDMCLPFKGPPCQDDNDPDDCDEDSNPNY